MRVTYLVLVHQKPRQLAVLLDEILSSGDRAVVHVDAKSDLEQFRSVVAERGDAVMFTDRRFDVRWGNFRSVDATLEALRTVVGACPADYYYLLSGADLPIKSAARLHAQLHSGAVYMDCFPMPDDKRNKPISRLEHFYVAFKDRNSRLAMGLNEVVLPRLPKRRVDRGLGGLRPYGGSQWWAVPHECAVELLRFVDASPRLVRFFRHSRVPDEMFFQTVLQGLPRAWEVRRKLTYDDWHRPEVRGTSPATLGVRDLPTLATVPHFFARKFDLDADPAVHPAIRRELLVDAETATAAQ